MCTLRQTMLRTHQQEWQLALIGHFRSLGIPAIDIWYDPKTGKPMPVVAAESPIPRVKRRPSDLDRSGRSDGLHGQDGQ